MNIHTSTSLHKLFDIASQNIKDEFNSIKDPFYSPQIVFRNPQIQRWFKIEYAKKFGIAINIESQQIESCISALLDAMNDKIISRADVLFKIFAEMSNLTDGEYFNYINAKEEGRKKRLCSVVSQLADIIYDYPLTFPELWSAWRNGKYYFDDSNKKAKRIEKAQKKLFDSIFSDGVFTGTEELIRRAKNNQSLKKRLNTTIHLFATDDEGVIFHPALIQISSILNINLYLPISYDSGKNHSEPEFEKRDLFLIQKVAEAYPDSKVIFNSSDICSSAGNNHFLLSTLEKGRGENTGDRIRFVAAPSIVREVETLANYLFYRFSKDKTLKPHEVGIICTDTIRYADVLKSVFSRRGAEIPFAQVGIARESDYYSAVIKLLELPGLNYTRAEVVALLSNKCFSARFNISESEIVSIKNLICELGIFRFLDATSRKKANAEELKEFTWQQGLMRLRLGKIMESRPLEETAQKISYKELVPFETEDETVVLKLNNILSLLFKELEQISNCRLTPKMWAEKLKRLASIFLTLPEENILEESASTKMIRLLDEWNQASEERIKLGIEEVTYFLRDKLNYLALGTKRIFVDGVAVGNMETLHGVPFRVLCILGLDEDSFPSNEKKLEPDLSSESLIDNKSTYELRDYSRLAHSIRNAGDYLYLSYTCRDLQSDREIFPSAAVAEILHSIFPWDGKFVQVPISPYSIRYLGDEADKFPDIFGVFRKEDFEVIKVLNLPQEQTVLTEADVNKSMSQESKKIYISWLKDFLNNPVEGLLRSRLEINEHYEEKEDSALLDFEPFEVESRIKHELVENAVRVSLNELNKIDDEKFIERLRNRTEILYSNFRSASKTPAGFFARFSFLDIMNEVESRIAGLLENKNVYETPVDMVFGNVSRSGLKKMCSEKKYQLSALEFLTSDNQKMFLEGTIPSFFQYKDHSMTVAFSWRKQSNSIIESNILDSLLGFIALKASGNKTLADQLDINLLCPDKMKKYSFCITNESAGGYMDNLIRSYETASWNDFLPWDALLDKTFYKKVFKSDLVYSQESYRELLIELIYEKYEKSARTPMLLILNLNVPSDALSRFMLLVKPLLEWSGIDV